MRENDFNLDTTVQEKRVFLKKNGILFGAALFLTGMTSLIGLMALSVMITDSAWRQTEQAAFAWYMVLTVIMILIFVSLVKIVADKKPFSKTLTWSIRMIGILLLIASFTIPRLAGYRSSGYDLIAWGNYVLIDAAAFIPGLLLIILANIIMAGFYMQKEMDEIL